MSKFIFIILCFVGLFIVEALITLILEIYASIKFKKFAKNDSKYLFMDEDERNKHLKKDIHEYFEYYIWEELDDGWRKALRIFKFLILFILARPIFNRYMLIKFINSKS